MTQSLQAIRRANRLTQRDVAATLNISQTLYALTEQGKRPLGRERYDGFISSLVAHGVDVPTDLLSRS